MLPPPSEPPPALPQLNKQASPSPPRVDTIAGRLVNCWSQVSWVTQDTTHPTDLVLVPDSHPPAGGSVFLHSTSDELQCEELEGTGTGLCLQTSNTTSR